MITSNTFSPVYFFELLHVSVSLEFRHRVAFGWIILRIVWQKPLLKKTKQQNVILTELVLTFFITDVCNSEENFLFCTHRNTLGRYTLKKTKKIKSLLSKHVQIMNLIRAQELLWKAERWYKKYKTCQFYTKNKFQNNGSQKNSNEFFITSQQTFQSRFNFVFRLIWRCDVAQRQINIDTTLCTSTLKFTTLNNIETRFWFFNVKLNNVRQRRSNL